MLSFLQRHKGLVVVGVLLVLPLVLLYAQTRRGGAHGPVVGVVVDIAGAVERAVIWATGGVADGIEHYVTSVGAWEELTRLRRERVARTALEDRIAELSIENESLRALANASAAVDGPRPLGARVIGRRGQPLTRLLVVDKGSRHGIRRGDGVIGADGVVGVVLTVARASSEVLLLSDASSALDIVVQRSRARGILRGSGDDDRYAAVVEDFDRLRDVRPADVIVTSGFGARFPPGTRVGTIAEVKDRDDLNVEAVILPAVNLARVEHVAILVGREAPLPPALGEGDDEDVFGSGLPGAAVARPTEAGQVTDPAAAAPRRRKRDATDDDEKKPDEKKGDDKKADEKKNNAKKPDDAAAAPEPGHGDAKPAASMTDDTAPAAASAPETAGAATAAGEDLPRRRKKRSESSEPTAVDATSPPTPDAQAPSSTGEEARPRRRKKQAESGDSTPGTSPSPAPATKPTAPGDAPASADGPRTDDAGGEKREKKRRRKKKDGDAPAAPAPGATP